MAVTLVASAQTNWANDPYHSRLGFVVKHLTISEINGAFSDFAVKVVTNKADYSDMKVSVTAKTASINTGIEMRDKAQGRGQFAVARVINQRLADRRRRRRAGSRGRRSRRR